MRILNFGSCNIDYVYGVEHIVSAGETVSAQSMNLFPGGKGLNQSIAAARAGAEVYHAGCIGEDGRLLADTMTESGVDLTYLKQENSKTGHAVIQVDANGENSIFVYEGTNGKITEEYIDDVLQNFGEGDYLLLQNEISNIHYLVERAFERRLRIIFNPSPFREALKKLDLNKLFCLVLNEVEAKEFTGSEEPEEIFGRLLKRYPGLKIMLTLGKKGCIYADKENTLSHAAYRVNAVDTTAAGDTFTGYFVALLSRGRSLEEAIELATAASAISVSRMGASPSIPVMAEVKGRLQQLEICNAENRTKRQKQTELIKSYIDSHLINANITELSELLGYSGSYTGSLVKKLTGKSFSELLTLRRCKAAAVMLKEKDISVGEIIHLTGYENESFFRKKFREIYNVSPLEYRKKGGIVK